MNNCHRSDVSQWYSGIGLAAKNAIPILKEPTATHQSASSGDIRTDSPESNKNTLVPFK